MLVRSLKFALLGALFALSLAGAAPALEISKVPKETVELFMRAAPADARTFLAGYTVHVKLGRVQVKVLNVLPISTIAILYFAPDGALLGWSDKSEVIERGIWKIDSKPNGNNVCMFFDKSKGAGVCTILNFGRPTFLESVKGNPFGLKANAPVPYDLGRVGVSLRAAAKKLGL